nr:MAG TPA: hypothetical protein [Caudoviricetes sp.]
MKLTLFTVGVEPSEEKKEIHQFPVMLWFHEPISEENARKWLQSGMKNISAT